VNAAALISRFQSNTHTQTSNATRSGKRAACILFTIHVKPDELNSENAQISDISDVETTKILFEFLVDQKKLTEQFFTRLID